MANIPITDNTTLLNALKIKAQNLPNRGSGSGGGSGSTDLSFVTATASDILEGKKGADSSGNVVNGSMTNRGAWSSTKTSNGDVTIPAGFHDGSGKVSVDVSTTVESGELDTPTVSFDTTNGRFTTTAKVKTSGYISTSATKTNSYSLTRNLGGTITPAKDSQTISLSGQYCTGDYVVNGDSNLVPENIKKNIFLFGEKGTYAGDGGYVTGTIEPKYSNGNEKDMVWETDYIKVWCVAPSANSTLSTPKMLMITVDASDSHKRESSFCGAYFDLENNTALISNSNIFTANSYSFNEFSTCSGTCGTSSSSDCVIALTLKDGKPCYFIKIKRDNMWIYEPDYKYRFVAVW